MIPSRREFISDRLSGAPAPPVHPAAADRPAGAAVVRVALVDRPGIVAELAQRLVPEPVSA